MRKFTHKVAVGTVRDIITEGEHNAQSGDPRLAASGRSNAILGMILLQLLSAYDEKPFNDIKLTTYNKGELSKEEAAEDHVGAEEE